MGITFQQIAAVNICPNLIFSPTLASYTRIQCYIQLNAGYSSDIHSDFLVCNGISCNSINSCYVKGNITACIIRCLNYDIIT